jgi:transposase
VTNVKLTPEQWKRILEFLRTRIDLYIGKPTDCKRFVNAVLYMTRSGIQGRLLPKKYGKCLGLTPAPDGLAALTGCSRFNRWSEQNIWQAILEHFTSDADMESVMIDATHVRVHSSAAAKGGIKKNKDSAEAKAGS